MGVQQHIDSPPSRSTWTWKAPQGQRRCYDYVFANKDHKYEGAPTDINKRGDHGAVAMQLQGQSSHKIYFGGPPTRQHAQLAPDESRVGGD